MKNLNEKQIKMAKIMGRIEIDINGTIVKLQKDMDYRWNYYPKCQSMMGLRYDSNLQSLIDTIEADKVYLTYPQ